MGKEQRTAAEQICGLAYRSRAERYSPTHYEQQQERERERQASTLTYDFEVEQ